MSYIKIYGFLGVIRLGISWLYTKIFYTKAKLIRLPIDIRGKRCISIGERFTTGTNCRLEAYDFKFTGRKLLYIGNDVQINDSVHITATDKVQIGDNVLIASRVYISDVTHGNYDAAFSSSPYTPPALRQNFSEPVFIEDNVWIGEGVVILPGVRIGFGSIVGANSVVTKNVQAMHIVAGVPAKTLKKYNKLTMLWERV